MPVLPEDDSRITCPEPRVRVPSFSASSIIQRAARSFTEPPGFCPSSLARIRTFGFGLSADTSTIGVLPMRSSAESYTGTAGAPRKPTGQVDNTAERSSRPPEVCAQTCACDGFARRPRVFAMASAAAIDDDRLLGDGAVDDAVRAQDGLGLAQR